MSREEKRALLRQEVEELTALLRGAPEWKDLRLALQSKGLKAEDVLLAAFYEDEDKNEYGIVVTPERGVFEFKRSTRRGMKPLFQQWLDRGSSQETLQEYPAIAEAFALLGVH